MPFRHRPLGACILPRARLTAEGSVWVKHHRFSQKINGAAHVPQASGPWLVTSEGRVIATAAAHQGAGEIPPLQMKKLSHPTSNGRKWSGHH